MGDWVCSECRFLCWASKNECRECGASGNDPVSRSQVQTARPQQPPIRVALRNALCVDALDAYANGGKVFLISGGEKIEAGTAASRRSPEADKKRIPVTPVKVQSQLTPLPAGSVPSIINNNNNNQNINTKNNNNNNNTTINTNVNNNQNAQPISPLPTSTSFDTTWMPPNRTSILSENNGFLSRQKSRGNNNRRNPPTPLLPIFASGWATQDRHLTSPTPTPFKSTGLLTPISSPTTSTSNDFTLADLHVDAQKVERRTSASFTNNTQNVNNTNSTTIKPIGPPNKNFNVNLPSPPQSANSSPNKFDPFNQQVSIPTTPSEQDVEDALFKASTALVEFCLS